MKELFRAKEIHQEIIGLDKEIIKLESNLDKIINENLDGRIELTVNLKKDKKLKMDEDGSIVQEDSFRITFGSIAYLQSGNKEDDTKEKFITDLSESELILMFATLLRHKQDTRKKLINEFNDLSIKLKI